MSPSSGSKSKPRKKPAKAGGRLTLVGILFDSECGGYMFLRNVGLTPNFTALNLRRPT
jgi:hypothetical protein